MNSKTQLELLRQLRTRQSLLKQGFTLVELMIVVAIIGLLSAVALPQFLGARDRADSKAKIGEVVGLAKECATYQAEADSMTVAVKKPGGGTIACGGSVPSPQAMTSQAWALAQSVSCLGSALVGSNKRVVISVAASGDMNCTGAAS
jgi:type IV pilus assembly protein PilA